MIDLRKRHDDLIEIIGRSLSAVDSQARGLQVNSDDWVKKYHGNLYPYSQPTTATIELNIFRKQVDATVGHLMNYLDAQ
jgi:hypothetical protein